MQTSPTARAFRRPLPGSRGWTGDSILIGNLSGSRRAKRGGAPSSKWLVAPTDSDPSTWIWPVEGRHIVLLDASPKGDESYRVRLIQSLIADGAALVVLLVSSDEPDGIPVMSFHRKPEAP